jgi:hypothetical protein
MDSAVWTSYCGVTGKSHENLIQCSDCHAKNPQISHSFSSSTSVRREVVDLSIDSPPSRTQAAVSVSAAPRFASYNREHGAEALRQTHFTQHPSSVRSGRHQSSTSSPAPLSYRAVVSFYLSTYELVQGLAQTIDNKLLGMYNQILKTSNTDIKTERIVTRIPSRTIESLQDFIIRDLLSGIHGFIRQTTDRLRLATAVSKDGPVFLSRSANIRQATDDLLKTWFRTTGGGQEYNIFVIIERMQIPESDDDTSYDSFAQQEILKREDNKIKLVSKKEERTKSSAEEEESMKSSIKEEKRTNSNTKKKKGKQPAIKIERAGSPVQKTSEAGISYSQPVSRKRSRSDLSSPPPELTQTSYAYRTRQQHELDKEDLERIAQYD